MLCVCLRALWQLAAWQHDLDGVDSQEQFYRSRRLHWTSTRLSNELSVAETEPQWLPNRQCRSRNLVAAAGGVGETLVNSNNSRREGASLQQWHTRCQRRPTPHCAVATLLSKIDGPCLSSMTIVSVLVVPENWRWAARHQQQASWSHLNYRVVGFGRKGIANLISDGQDVNRSLVNLNLRLNVYRYGS
jgi:hypothetical protein